MKQIREKCINCLYCLILSIAILTSTFILPEFDRAIVRDVAGFLTLFSSIVGVIMCGYFCYIMSKGNNELNNRLKEVYFLMLVIFSCTGTFGILGIISPPLYIWDFVYNIRAVAILLEVIALFRFFKTWWKIGNNEISDQ